MIDALTRLHADTLALAKQIARWADPALDLRALQAEIERAERLAAPPLEP